jgi:hypothetical protein
LRAESWNPFAVFGVLRRISPVLIRLDFANPDKVAPSMSMVWPATVRLLLPAVADPPPPVRST